MEHLSCPACGSVTFTKLEYVDIPKQHAFYAPSDQMRQNQLTQAASTAALNYQMIGCLNCKLEFANPTIAPSPVWYDIAYQTLELYPSERWEFLFVLKNIKKDDKLLELGCGSGEFLKICKNEGIDAVGLDFSPDAIRQCLEAGLDAKILDLTGNADMETETKKDVITAFQVLEHLDKPQTIFEFAKKAAHKNSQLWIAIPSNLRPSRIFDEHDFLDQPPHHMTRWTEASLKEIGKQAGWELQKVYYEPLSITGSCWWITTRMKLFKSLTSVSSKIPLADRAIRTLLFPFALFLKYSVYKNMGGFSMLGLYKPATD
ncbi:MAG: class I SAM-dependent methyltransferase [Ferruginibacter sp.]